jgi:hypothetical protein
MRQLKVGDIIIAKKTSYMSGEKKTWITKGKRYRIVGNGGHGLYFTSDYSKEHYCDNFHKYFTWVTSINKQIRVL